MATDHNPAIAASSSNPFRRREPSSNSIHTPPPITVPDGLFTNFDDVPAPEPSSGSGSFRQQLQSLPKSTEAPPSTTFQRPKPVKKVRVQSPPPSSPESVGAEFETRFPAGGPSPAAHGVLDTDENSDDDGPFGDTLLSGRGDNYKASGGGSKQQQALGSTRPPPNPFSKTLGDLEQTSGNGEAGPATAGGKGSMDVDAFRRLLMTGQPGAPQVAPVFQKPHTQLSLHQGDAGSNTDTSSISRQSIFEASNLAQETPRTSHEISDQDDEHGLVPTPPAQRKVLRKKPPPPASRHGKPIRPEPVDHDSAEEASLTPNPISSSSSSDLNKPLPPAPRVPVDDVVESVFDKEAAGKIPEVNVDPDAPDIEVPPPRPPTPPNASHSTSTLPKKPAAPPPRRAGHGRNDSRATIVSLASPVAATHPIKEDETDGVSMRRPSTESTRSRSSSTRAPAPTPPPPRRPAATNIPARPNTGRASPGAPQTPTSPAFGLTGSEDGLAPLAPSISSSTPRVSSGGAPPPPPPPARKSSVRSGRPASIRSVDSISRRIDVGSGTATPISAPPPPPPPRPRGRGGGSKSGMDGVYENSVLKVHEAVPEEVDSEEPVPGHNILADLDALQREVDAMRGVK